MGGTMTMTMSRTRNTASIKMTMVPERMLCVCSFCSAAPVHLISYSHHHHHHYKQCCVFQIPPPPHSDINFTWFVSFCLRLWKRILSRPAPPQLTMIGVILNLGQLVLWTHG